MKCDFKARAAPSQPQVKWRDYDGAMVFNSSGIKDQSSDLLMAAARIGT
jgi:hypothetical protein